MSERQFVQRLDGVTMRGGNWWNNSNPTNYALCWKVLETKNIQEDHHWFILLGKFVIFNGFCRFSDLQRRKLKKFLEDFLKTSTVHPNNSTLIIAKMLRKIFQQWRKGKCGENLCALSSKVPQMLSNLPKLLVNLQFCWLDAKL